MKFECPHCHQHLETATLYGGQGTKCPSCGGDLRIPEGRANRPGEPSVAGEPTPADSHPSGGGDLQIPEDTGQPTPRCADPSGGGDQEQVPGAPSGSPPAEGSTQRGVGDAKSTQEEPAGPFDSAQGSHPPSADANWRVDITEFKNILQSSIDRDGVTITEYMSKQQLEGGVSLDSTDASSAAQVLTDEKGRKYKLGDVVAKGGMGAVINARDHNLRRTVAMKVLLNPKQATKEQVLRFIEEAQVTSQLQHPGIVPIHELGVDASGNVFYTMKFVQGRTLKHILKGIKDGDRATIEEYPLPRLLNVFQRVCDAVAFAHSRRVIHRDLKPENIMIGEYGEVQVMDWGLAKVLPKEKKKRVVVKDSAASQKLPENLIDSVRKDEGGDILKTLDGMIMGTPGFMAPEQALGDTESFAETTDVYALGAILYNILTLQPPITGSTVDEILKKITGGQITPPVAFNPSRGGTRAQGSGVGAEGKAVEGEACRAVSPEHLPNGRMPDALSAVAMKALSMKQDSRYQSVKDLQRDIEAYQTGFATSVEQAGAWKQFTLLVKRNKGVFTAIAAAVVIVAGVVATSYMANRRERIRAEDALQKFENEQAQRKGERKTSAPAMLKAAKAFVEQNDCDSARRLLDSAIEYAPESVDAYLVRALLLMDQKDFAGALADAQRCVSLKGNTPEVGAVCRLASAGARGNANLSFSELSNVSAAHGMPLLGTRFMAGLQERFQVYQAQVNRAWPGLGSSSLQIASGLLRLRVYELKTMVTLAPLAGIPIQVLQITGTPIKDLAPLRGMPLRHLSLNSTAVSDLHPLADMPLEELLVYNSPILDCGPLKGLPLRRLHLTKTSIRDLSPLREMPLVALDVSGTGVADLSPLRGVPLKELSMAATSVSSLAPLAGMRLERLDMGGLSSAAGAPVTDLTPLKGMPIRILNMERCPVSDLTPLRSMPLEDLNIAGTRVTNLSPLAGMPLKNLCMAVDLRIVAPVSDLTPLKGMPLQQVSIPVSIITNGLGVIREMKSLVTINGLPSTEFWKKLDAGEFNPKPAAK